MRQKRLKTPGISGTRRKKYLGAKCDVIIYDITNQVFECDTDELTDAVI